MQCTATERANSQAIELGIEHPKLRNRPVSTVLDDSNFIFAAKMALCTPSYQRNLVTLKRNRCVTAA
jgi:hypothetical protein